MSKAKWLLLFLVAICTAIPAYAVELSLGGFPSYMRTRARYFGNATFLSSITDAQAEALGFSNADDNIFFVDTRLRLTPQLVLSDAVTIRAQVDVFDNVIWGGTTSALLGGRSTLVNSSITTGDRFRGALLIGANAIDRGIGESDSTDDVQFFNVRMLHADIVLPSNLGFVRIGRQPFDWGLGILANGGWDPLSDLGFVLDRFLYLKSFPIGAGTFTFVFVSDIFTQGNTVVTANGNGYDIGAVALIYNTNVGGGNLTVGVYDFPYIHQNNLGTVCPGAPFGEGPGAPPNCGFGVDLDWANLYSGLIDFKTDRFRLVGEIQGEFGEIDAAGTTIDIENNIIFAVRGEVYPGWPIKNISAEFGWADGGDVTDGDVKGGNEGGLVFSPAYNLDNLMFKHMIPTIYQIEGSVINAFYARAWGTVKLLDNLSFTPQVVVAWNEETDNPLPNSGDVSRYLGTEVEGTLTVNVVPGVNLDIIGGLVFLGSGMEDLIETQAANAGAVDPDAESVAWTAQARMIIYIDQFFK
jgi:hypothetical protein